MGIHASINEEEGERLIGKEERQTEDVYELLYLINKSPNKNTIADMYAYILANEVDHPDLYLSLPSSKWGWVLSALYEKLLLTLLESNPGARTRAGACCALATGYFDISQKLRMAELSGKTFSAWLAASAGGELDETLIHWAGSTADELEAKTRKYAELAKAEYGGESLFASRVDEDEILTGRKTGSVAALMEELLYKLDHFSVGKIIQGPPVTTVNGKTLPLADREGRVALIDFWSAGCGPCRAKMPFLKDLQANLADQPFDLIMLNVDQDRSVLDKCIDELDLQEMNISSFGHDDRLLKWGINAYPTFVLVDQKGVIIDRELFTDAQIVNKLTDVLGKLGRDEQSSQTISTDHSSVKLMKTFASSMGKWIKSGMKTSSAELVELRLATCQSCPHLQDQGAAFVQKAAAKIGFGDGNCNLCGCSVKAKALIPGEDCPAGAVIDGMSPWQRAEARLNKT